MEKHFFKFRFWGTLTALAVVAGFTVVAMLLWNALMPDIFGLPVLSYWQTLGLGILARIFFGGFGGGRLLRGGFGRDERLFPHNVLRERWQNMSEEERREVMRHHHGFERFGGGRGRCGGGDESGGKDAPSQKEGE